VLYLGSCSVQRLAKANQQLREQTGAIAVLGYTKAVDWYEAAGFEVMVGGRDGNKASLGAPVDVAALEMLGDAAGHARVRIGAELPTRGLNHSLAYRKPCKRQVSGRIPLSRRGEPFSTSLTRSPTS
jgi:hypothetical protein